MSAAKSYVPTAAIRDAANGQETEILKALGIQWNGNARHIVCPYPDHADREPSWRWDDTRKFAFCSCIGTRPGEKKAHNIFGVAATKEGIDRETAMMRVAEIIGRPDLVSRANVLKYQRTDAATLLRPLLENRDDALAWSYLAHRLGIEPDRVPRPATMVIGIKLLAYFDPPQQLGGRVNQVGNFPAAVFETVDRDGNQHAHRIYLGPKGAGKADLGVASDGVRRTTKKSAKKTKNNNIAGHAVIWGVSSTAETAYLFEGIETAAAAALAFATEIAAGKLMIAACITAGGVEAFKPWPTTRYVIVGADRDDVGKDGRPATRRGEVAARKFADLNQHGIAVSIALPGMLGEKLDWLDVLRSDGVAGVRNGILAGHPYTRTSASVDDRSCREQQPQSSIGDDDGIARLAAMSPLLYDRAREAEAKRLGVRVGTLDKEVERARGQAGADDLEHSGVAAFLANPEPWSEPVSGADLLDKLTETARAHLVLPSGAAESIALWVLHAHAHDRFDISPILCITSPTPECGKTTCLTLLGGVVPRACPASNITTAALFRTVEKWQPTLLIDEADTFLRSSDELRGILNSGHHRANAYVIRTTGDEHEPKRFRTWAPKAIALIGKLPATLASRSLHIELRRKTPAERVEVLRLDRLDHLEPLRRQASRWAADNAVSLSSADPEMPESLSGRTADNWRPLLAIADIAGGTWPARARRVAQKLGGSRSEQTAGIMLLEDINRIFADMGDDRLRSEDLAAALSTQEDRPWPEWHQGRPISPRQIAKVLEPFKLKPGTIRTKKGTAKGYKLDQFTDAFARYLPVPQIQTVTPSPPLDSAGFWKFQSDRPSLEVTDENAQDASVSAGCDGVTDGELVHSSLDDATDEETEWTV